jgi:protein-S-isoprenylcysteine O-methyltransferase Ste14
MVVEGQASRTELRSLLKGFKHLLGVGPCLLVLGLLLEAATLLVRPWVSFPISLTVGMQLFLTVPCVAVCALGMLWFNRSLNLVEVNLLDGEDRLVAHGPFGYVRHPLYSTLLATIPPLVIIWLSDLLFLLPWVLMSALSRCVVSIEERGLVERFGQDYEMYRRYVPALLPYKGNGGQRYRKRRAESTGHEQGMPVHR